MRWAELKMLWVHGAGGMSDEHNSTPPPQAFDRGLRYPQYLFLTYAWYSDQWWELDTENLTCSADDRASVLPRTLALLHFDFIQHFDLESPTDTDIVSC